MPALSPPICAVRLPPEPLSHPTTEWKVAEKCKVARGSTWEASLGGSLVICLMAGFPAPYTKCVSSRDLSTVLLVAPSGRERIRKGWCSCGHCAATQRRNGGRGWVDVSFCMCSSHAVMPGTETKEYFLCIRACVCTRGGRVVMRRDFAVRLRKEESRGIRSKEVEVRSE